jgi:hypothetical protein
MNRVCRVCHIEKDIVEFYNTTAYKDGKDTQCKACKNKYDKIRVMTWGREKRTKNQKDYKLRLRIKLLQAYGHICACCGETTDEFLELDHINGGGNRHRKSEKRDLYQVAKLEGYPKDKYRLLCANCNHSLGMKGYCPHQRKIKNVA